MKPEESFAVELCTVVCIICLIAGMLAGNMFTSWGYEKSAVEYGVGRYNEKTAEFEWITDK